MRISDWSSDVCSSDLQILFVRDGDQLEVTVVDDGVGGVDTDGNGLAGMRGRIARMGGTLAIESPRRQGTRLRLRVPLVSAEAEATPRSEEHTSELQSLMRISYAVFCLKKKKRQEHKNTS